MFDVERKLPTGDNLLGLRFRYPIGAKKTPDMCLVLSTLNLDTISANVTTENPNFFEDDN